MPVTCSYQGCKKWVKKDAKYCVKHEAANLQGENPVLKTLAEEVLAEILTATEANAQVVAPQVAYYNVLRKSNTGGLYVLRKVTIREAHAVERDGKMVFVTPTVVKVEDNVEDLFGVQMGKLMNEVEAQQA